MSLLLLLRQPLTSLMLILGLLTVLNIKRINSQVFQLNPANQRVFLYRFFQYFNQIPPNELSLECRTMTKYFWSHQTDDWAEKSIYIYIYI